MNVYESGYMWTSVDKSGSDWKSVEIDSMSMGVQSFWGSTSLFALLLYSAISLLVSFALKRPIALSHR